MFLYSALIVGFVGSLHCVGMCGPIALSLPLQDKASWRFLFGRLMYNSGRVVTYTFLGVLAGLIGHTIAMAGFQRYLSIASGLLILLAVAVPVIARYLERLSASSAKWTGVIRSGFRKLFSSHSGTRLFAIGLVNGLLPCGMVYLAVAAAVATGDVVSSATYMFLFGLGTVPAMFAMTVAGSFFGFRFQKAVRQLTPVIAIVIGVLLIIRGLTTNPKDCCRNHKASYSQSITR
ncbi:MAG: sulfite exporter TauE/SafE family protein [Candidatus Pollutiaquabacter aromativorans]|jgi:sulfite exporter TauE/SafE